MTGGQKVKESCSRRYRSGSIGADLARSLLLVIFALRRSESPRRFYR